MRKIIAFIMTASLIACGGLTTMSASAEQSAAPSIEIINLSNSSIQPFASESISSWLPILSRTAYGANVTLKATYSGSITVELHNASGRIDSFTESFSNRSSLFVTKSRSQASGSYKIVVRVTINGINTTRESSFISI